MIQCLFWHNHDNYDNDNNDNDNDKITYTIWYPLKYYWECNIVDMSHLTE